MYDYRTPDGYGDYFFTYVYNPAESGLTDGEDAHYIPIEIQDGDFVLRVWSGADSCLANSGPVSANGTIQIYDAQTRLFFDLPVSVFDIMHTGAAVLPEKIFPANSALRFDLNNVQIAQDETDTTPVAQLAFHGVRRIRGAVGDPLPSAYKYKEVDFSIPFSFPLPNDATATGPGGQNQYTVQIQDYDFELRRIEVCLLGGGELSQVEVSDVILLSPVLGAGQVTVGSFDNGPDLPFVLTIVGSQITIQVATTGGISPTTTMAQMIAAINATGLVTASIGFGLPADIAPVSDGYSTVGAPAASNFLHPEFQITLYDPNWVARSNSPVNCNRLLHYGLGNGVDLGGAPMNFFPSPGILYPVNGVIRFDIYSLLPSSANATGGFLVFKGVRRLPC